MTDTHVHLTDAPLRGELGAVLEEAGRAGVDRFVVPGYDPASWEESARLYRDRPETLRRAAGLHPLHLGSGSVADLIAHCDRHPVHAIGEIGLDRRAPAPRAEQETAFAAQLDFAASRGLPVILHCVGWPERALAILSPYRGRMAGVLHAFSASREMAGRFLDLGFCIGFSGNLTLESHRRARELAAFVPLDRALLETDAPYLANAAHAAGRSRPADLAAVARAFAALRGGAGDPAPALEANAQALFFGAPRPC